MGRDKEKLKAWKEKYKKENREEILSYANEYNKKYYEKNKDKIKEAGKKYYEEHKNNIDFIEKKKERVLKNKQRDREQVKIYSQSLNGRFSTIKSGAKRKNIVFEIDLCDYEKQFYKKLCLYCGDVSTGIDRIDSKIGYSISNMVPCCDFCNYAKHKLTVLDFTNHINKIGFYFIDSNLCKNLFLNNIDQNEYDLLMNKRFNSIKNSAAVRNIDFLLTFENYKDNFFKKNCMYCGEESIGVDRVDSKKNYEPGNMVPCCTICNRIKLDYTYEEFIEKINKIYQNIKSGKI